MRGIKKFFVSLQADWGDRRSADADLNGDGKVDVADVVTLEKMILDGK